MKNPMMYCQKFFKTERSFFFPRSFFLPHLKWGGVALTAFRGFKLWTATACANQLPGIKTSNYVSPANNIFGYLDLDDVGGL